MTRPFAGAAPERQLDQCQIAITGCCQCGEIERRPIVAISPLLANLYLHHVYDLWARQWYRQHATGEMLVVRYADDTVVGFDHHADAERFLQVVQTASQRGVGRLEASAGSGGTRLRPR